MGWGFIPDCADARVLGLIGGSWKKFLNSKNRSLSHSLSLSRLLLPFVKLGSGRQREGEITKVRHILWKHTKAGPFVIQQGFYLPSLTLSLALSLFLSLSVALPVWLAEQCNVLPNKIGMLSNERGWKWKKKNKKKIRDIYQLLYYKKK